MSATNPLSAQSVDLASWSADDTAVVTNYLATLTDGDKATSAVAVGTSPDDGLRLLFPDYSKVKAGDTISIWVSSLGTFATMALLPYDGDFSVATGNKITLTPAVGENKFTLTNGFLTDLNVSGADKWSVRVVEDSGISGVCRRYRGNI